MKYENKEAFEQVNMFGTGTPNTAYAKFFIGDSFLNPLTDPKGSLIVECGRMLRHFGYRIKVMNTINFAKSMHYNRATCSLLKRWRTALFQSVL